MMSPGHPLYDHNTGKINLAAAAAAKRELMRRAALVQRAMEIFARLTAGVSLKVSLNRGASKAATAAMSSQASLKLALAFLLDENALQALLGELETALANCEESKREREPEIYAQGLEVHAAIAQFLPAYLAQLSLKGGLDRIEAEVSAPAFGGR